MASMLRCALLFLLALSAPFAFAQSYTIPVVVHVLWATPMQNVTDAQILSALDKMNTDYNSVSIQPIDPPYDTLAASMDISFCLASTAPDGTPTTGIERMQTPLAVQGGTAESYLNQWPPAQYLNIWVVGQMAFGAYHGSLGPDSAAVDPGRDGVMVVYNALSGFDDGTLTFQTARYLDLKLLWQDPIDGGPCGDDGVADTPPCMIFVQCSSTAPDGCADQQPLMLENYMTYSGCGRMFTQGQKDRVYAALNSSVAQRNNLWTTWNLGLTGCGPLGTAEVQATEQGLQVITLAEPGHWSLHFPQPGTWQVTAFTSAGQQAGHWQTGSDKLAIDLGGKATGLYLLRAENAQGERYSAKVLRP